MSRSLRISLPTAWTARSTRLTAVPAVKDRAIAAQWLLVLGVALVVLVWLISVGILLHDMVTWWAEFSVRPLQTWTEGPPPGW